MFSGIVEAQGQIVNLNREGSNIHFMIEAPFADELKIDQSVAHNGVCLTVTSLHEKSYAVTAIDETLKKTNLSSLKPGDAVNLERCLVAGARIDGHFVQGHVDQTGICTGIIEQNGSWLFRFEYDPSLNNITVPKGSICINGVSLTIVDSDSSTFSVAVIPFTFQNTNFSRLQRGDKVNLEFDIIGKYIQKVLAGRL